MAAHSLKRPSIFHVRLCSGCWLLAIRALCTHVSMNQPFIKTSKHQNLIWRRTFRYKTSVPARKSAAASVQEPGTSTSKAFAVLSAKLPTLVATELEIAAWPSRRCAYRACNAIDVVMQRARLVLAQQSVANFFDQLLLRLCVSLIG